MAAENEIINGRMVFGDEEDENENVNEPESPERAKSEKKVPESKKLKSQIKALEKSLEEEKEKVSESETKYQYLAAEYENYRRRSAKEKDAVYSDAVADCLKELLPLIDNLQRATQYTTAENVAEGLEMILKTLPDVFSKLGITEFGEPGEQFDPNIHNAVMHIEDETLGENVIADVFQKGYMRGDKIIRCAMVRVAN